MKIRFKHPLRDEYAERELGMDAVIGDIDKKLVAEGFLEPKRGGYHYIINDRLCAKNMPISAYVAEPAPDMLDVTVSGMLTILI